MTENLSPWHQWKKNLGETRPWDLWDPSVERATDDLASQRFNVCSACPELIKISAQCKKCGCFMHLKTKLQKASCPIGKW